MKRGMIRTNFYFPAQMLARLKVAKAKTGLAVSDILRRAVDDFLDKLGV